MKPKKQVTTFLKISQDETFQASFGTNTGDSLAHPSHPQLCRHLWGLKGDNPVYMLGLAIVFYFCLPLICKKSSGHKWKNFPKWWINPWDNKSPDQNLTSPGQPFRRLQQSLCCCGGCWVLCWNDLNGQGWHGSDVPISHWNRQQTWYLMALLRCFKAI